MAIALVAHVAERTTSFNTFTTASIDTTGADLLVVFIADTDGTTTLSDSKSNTWTPLTTRSFSGNFLSTYYAKNAAVGTGHTFTATGTGKAQSVAASAWSGSDLTAPFDQQNGAGNFGTSGQPGSITPSVDGCVVITGIGHRETTGSVTVSSPFSPALDSLVETQGHGIGHAYEIQTTATARNPTWTWTNGKDWSIEIASFKAAAGATGLPPGLGPEVGMTEPVVIASQAAMMR